MFRQRGSQTFPSRVMHLPFFHQDTRRVFLGRRGDVSKFGHTFGGLVDYTGLTAYPGEPPAHLLFRLNTEDPAVEVTVPGSKWLPLLCAIRYGACPLGYRVVSDNEVKILYQHEAKAWPDFPSDDFPSRLPSGTLALSGNVYNSDDPEDAHFYGDVFGYAHLTPAQHAAVAQYVAAEGWHDLSGWEVDEYLEASSGFTFSQGRPHEACPDPSCRNHGRDGSLRVLATLREGANDPESIWGGARHEGIQVIFLICPECSAVLTTNQCT